MIEEHDIVCFGPGDWWQMNPSCTQHIMRRLSKRNRVLYVNPISSDLPAKVSRGIGKRLLRKAKSTLRTVRRESANLHTMSPVFLPVQGRPGLDRFNNWVIRRQIAVVLRVLRLRPSILWLENARAADALSWYPGAISVYHVSDDFAECPYTRNQEALRRREQRITQASDLLVCVSRRLHDAKRALRGDAVEYLPHGVDFSKFEEVRRQGTRSKYLVDVPRPIAGYYGTLTAQNDIELLTWCAEKAPDISFVFGGTITAGDYSRLQALPNTRFLGQIPYEDIAALACSFDICLLPWRMTDWIDSCSPLKLYEYLASGRPIVSVPIPQVVEECSGLVSVAGSKEEFLAGLRHELAADTDARSVARIAAAAGHSWEHHLETLSGYLEARLTRPDTDGRAATAGSLR